MAGNNYDPWANQQNPNVTGNPSPWNSPSQPAGQGWYQPPTTMTGYDAKFPIPNADPQAPVPPTPVQMPYDAAYRQAEKRVQARLRFYKHLTSYLIVNGFLWIIAFMGWIGSGASSVWTLIWPVWVSVFWGIGLLSDYIQTFSLNETTRQRMIEEEMRRMRR
jgi:hypothetical protein